MTRPSRRIVASSVLVAIALAIVSVAADAPARSSRVRGPWLLTTLPSMGSVTWRCDVARERAGRSALALGFRASAAAATEVVELTVAGRRVVRRTLQPGQSVTLPYLGHAVQQLSVVQRTEPGTLRAVVRVDFSPRSVSPSHCWRYLPPAVTIRVFPR